MAILLFIASPVLAGGPNYKFDDPQLNAEVENIYKDLKYPKWVNATGSTLTVTYINVSSITVNGSSLSSGPGLASTQTWTGGNTFTGTFTASTGTIKSFMVVGTATNDDAPIGRIGEVAECSGTGTITNAGGNCCSISVTPGNWDISAQGTYNGTAGSNSQHIGISLNTGSFTGTAEGFTSQWGGMYSAGGVGGTAIKPVNFKFTSTTTVYLVCQQGDANKAGGWSMQARRVR